MSNGRPPPLDPPSRRWDRDDVTPTPVDTVALAERTRGRLTSLEERVARADERMRAAVDEMARRLSTLEDRAAKNERRAEETSASLGNLHRDSAVIAAKLDAVQQTLVRIEAQRDIGGQRARNTVQLVLMLLAILASIVVGVVSIVTR